MRYRVLPYRQGSKSAKALSEALGGKVLLLVGSKFIVKGGDVIINWGSHQAVSETIPPFPALPAGQFLTVYNNVNKVRNASNKARFFQTMSEGGCDEITPDWFLNQDIIPNEAFPIVCRTVLAGHSGAGIVLANTREELVPAPLYVQYIKKEQEYRVHVGMKDGEPVVIAVQRKARKHDVPDDQVNWKVRNLAGGFVYVREGFTAPPSVIQAAKTALQATGLDFGAVDVIWNAHQERPYVLEINTAPGLEGQTVEDYAAFFKGIA